MSGILYLVATPIGNLEDISYRALRIMEEADYIACEDTRHTIKLLNHFDIKKPLISYHEHNRFEKGPKIIEDIEKGMKVVLVSDAGTPAISDPGEDLVKLCIESGVAYTSIPGPVALINALVLSGKDTRRFCFEGFLPFQKKERQGVIDLLKEEVRTSIFYESPHKLKKTLNDLYKGLGDRNISLIRELTKKFEECFHTTLSEAIEYYQSNDPRGEYVLVLEGIKQEVLDEQAMKKWSEMSMEEHLEVYLNQGMTKKDGIKQVAKDRKLPKSEVYNYIHREK